MIRVLLDDGRCQKHYVEAEETIIFDDFMFFIEDPQNEYKWIGWKIDNCFYLRENVTGITIEEFKGIVVNVNGYEVLCEDPNDLFLTVQTQIGARTKEIKALQGYLERIGTEQPNPVTLNIADTRQNAAQEIMRNI